MSTLSETGHGFACGLRVAVAVQQPSPRATVPTGELQMGRQKKQVCFHDFVTRPTIQI
jgi:hypothetical protein